jgi:hypothetical protein
VVTFVVVVSLENAPQPWLLWSAIAAIGSAINPNPASSSENLFILVILVGSTRVPSVLGAPLVPPVATSSLLACHKG